MGRYIHVPAAVAASVLLLTSCGPTAAPGPDVDATVKAQVSATVQALARTQASPTRGAQVITIGPTAVSASPAAGTAVAGTASPATGTALAGTPAPLASTSPAATPPAQGTAAAASSTGPASTPLAAPGSPSPAGSGVAGFGTLARAGSFGITPQRYEWSAASCPGSGGAPAPGSKFVVVYAAGRNDGSAAADVPAQQWSLDGYPALSPGQAPCQPEGQPLAVACLAGSRLAPDARCEGWVLFQVPQAVTVEGATVGVLGGAAGQWRLPG